MRKCISLVNISRGMCPKGIAKIFVEDYSVVVVPYNAPRLSSCSTWSTDGITIINSTTGSSGPMKIFVTVDNTIYVTMRGLKQVQVWNQGNGLPTVNSSINSSISHAVFVTINGDIYFDSGDDLKRVDRWTQNAGSTVLVTPANKTCYGLFVDVIDNLYCAIESPDQVVMKAPGGAANSTVIVAGNGITGAGPNMLFGPRGIFVDTNLDLYVADCYNNRVQRFSRGQTNGTTVAGSGAAWPVILLWPTDVILDGNGYLYIVECNNHRVIASGPNGFRCIIACTGTTGLAANQLAGPIGLSFDSQGNLFVTDYSNNRVQKFAVATNSCGKWTSSVCCDRYCFYLNNGWSGTVLTVS